MLRTADLDYDLPGALIARTPAEPRDSARLLVVHGSDPARLEHGRVRDLPGLLIPGDLLVFNTTRVVPARFLGRRLDTRGRVEGLYLGPGTPDGTWEVMLKARRFREGAAIVVTDEGGRPIQCPGGQVVLTILRRAEADAGVWLVKAEVAGPSGRASVRPDEALEFLRLVGRTPIPPYIRAARRAAGMEVPDALDRDRYQTVYAKASGSVAAPTAGLHFTPELLSGLAGAGIGRADVTLHVGPGTFRPVETETFEAHPMHAEWCSMDEEAVRAVLGTRRRGGRVIAVGTTSARTLESYAPVAQAGQAPPASLQTRLLITPGYRWRWVDALLTNFHLPRSTLMALVAALLPGGPEQLRAVYRLAVAERYRFYSYGDAMLILP